MSLKEKIEWALASSISAPAGSKSRMIPAKGIPKLERELQVERVLKAFSAELEKIEEQAEVFPEKGIGSVNPVKAIPLSVIQKLRKELE